MEETFNLQNNEEKEEVVDNSNLENQVLKDYFIQEESNLSVKDIAKLFGQSEGEMSKEFGIFKAKKLYKKMDFLIFDNTLTFDELIKLGQLAVRYGFKGVTVPPSYIYTMKSVFIGKDLMVRTLIDYPYGQELFKTKLYSIKMACKKGVNSVIVTAPVNLIKNGDYRLVVKEFKKFYKITKKRQLSLLIDGKKLSYDEMENFIKLLVKEVKIHSIIPCNGFNEYINYNLVKQISQLVEGKCLVEGIGKMELITDMVTAINSGANEIISENCQLVADDLDGKINTIK